MKKIIFGLFTIALISTTAFSCKKDKNTKITCEKASANFQKALTDYSTDQSAAHCKSYKKAIQDLLKSECFATMSSEQKAEYQEMIDGLTCE